MNAEEFAQEFINDLPDTLQHMDINKGKFVFNIEVYEQDPNLEILRKELNKINYDLVSEEDLSTKTKISWKLVKI